MTYLTISATTRLAPSVRSTAKRLAWLATGAAAVLAAPTVQAQTTPISAGLAEQNSPQTPSVPIAADSGADVASTTVNSVVVTAKKAKADAQGYSNASKNSGQTYNLTATQTETRITQRELLEATSPVASISAAIENQPNTTTPTTTSPIVGGNIYIRGFSKGFLNVTLDGIPINLVENQTVYANQILPLGLTGSIDVKPGAGSAATVGYSDFGGTIDVNSANPSPSPFATLEGGFGSLGESKYGVTLNSGTFLGGTTSVIANINSQSASGYFDKGADGTTTESGRVTAYDQGAIKLVSHVGPGVLTGLISHTNEKFDVITGATSAEIALYGPQASAFTGPETAVSYWGNNFKKEYNDIAYLDYTLTLGSNITLSERPYYWLGFTYQSTVPTAKPYNSNYLEQGSLYRNFRYGDIFKADIAAASWIDIQTGVWIDATHLTDSEPLHPFTSAAAPLPEPLRQADDTYTFQPYIAAPMALTDHFTITPGVKFSYVSRDFRDELADAGYQKNWTNVLPSLGLNYILVGAHNAPVLSTYANYTRSFEPPTFSQISTTAQNFGLNPQLADSYEVGPIWDVGVWSGKISLFETHFLNYVQTETISNAAHPTGVSTYANAGGAIYKGVDISNSVNITSKIAAFANLGLLNADFTSQATPITYAPHRTGSVGLRYQGDNLQVGVSTDYNSGYFVNNGGTNYSLLKSFVVTNLFADYKLPVTLPHVASTVLSLNIDNAFNRRYLVDGTSFNGKATFEEALPFTAFADLKLRFH
jgi:iron complex outermembrane receptor protein